MTIRAASVLVVFLVALVASAASAQWQRTKTVAEAKFKGSGPGGFKMEGKTDAVKVVDRADSITILVDLTNLTTGIDLRDDHMRNKYLEVEKYPLTTLVVKKSSLKMLDGQGFVAGEAKGHYTLHGKTLEVPFKYSGKCDAAMVCQVSGEMKLNFNQFGIVVPKYMGITLKPDIVVTTTFAVRQMPGAPAVPTQRTQTTHTTQSTPTTTSTL